MSVIRDLFWTPFDVRFHLLLERLRDHQELFELEVKVENEKALKRFTDKAERLIDQADEVITQQKRLMDTPLNRVRLEEESTTRYSK
jgi:P2-related tail formation protein